MERPELLAGEREYGESNKAVQSCNDFLRMGPGRTLVALLKKYRDMPENTTPTRSRNTIENWSKKNFWFERAAAYDKRLEEEKNARARQIMESGLALDYERVCELKDLADFLKAQIYATETQGLTIAKSQIDTESQETPEEDPPGETAYPYVWVRDVKQIGAGENAEKVEIFRFNSAILEVYRGILDDIAKETGGRVSKHEMSGPNGGPIAVNDEQHDRAISSLAAALGALLPGSSAGEKDGLGSAE